MKKKLNTLAGFTLAELLIVVAIIGVLVAISIPIFGSRLEGSRESTDVANLRSAYAAATAVALTGKDSVGNTVTLSDEDDNDFIYTKDGKLDVTTVKNGMKGKSTQDGFQGADLGEDLPADISFDGNSGKQDIYVRIGPSGNKVQVQFGDFD